MAARKKKKTKSFSPVSLEAPSLTVAEVVLPEPERKTFDQVAETIQRELGLISIGLSQHCAMAIQFDKTKTPFCKVLALMQQGNLSSRLATDLVRLAFQDFGNKFAEFVKSELRHLF